MIMVLLAHVAAASDQASLWLETGFGSPTGLMGGRIGWSPTPAWLIEAGGGLGGLVHRITSSSATARLDGVPGVQVPHEA